VEPVEKAPAAGGDTRSTLLDQIRQGKELRKVTPGTSSAAKPDMVTENTLAGALARALADRAKAIHSDSDEEEDEEDDDDEWDE
jgi:neural Wiskott-Aldrich syndrome protein